MGPYWGIKVTAGPGAEPRRPGRRTWSGAPSRPVVSSILPALREGYAAAGGRACARPGAPGLRRQ